MNNKDRLELKRRLTKDNCTFTRMCTCYVDAEKNIISMQNKNFLNLDDTDFFKYLDIARDVFKGQIGNNLLNLEFGPIEQSGQQLLEDLRDSKLKDTELLELIFNRIIHSYGHVGNYLIVLFHDAYDVITKTSDGEKLDESEEVYEYIVGAICSVNLSAAGLGYDESENRITTRYRDWVVSRPETGFIWPAFTDRQENREAAVFYTRDARHPRVELITNFLGCKEILTFTERREHLKELVHEVLGEDDLFYEFVNEHLLSLAEYPEMVNGEIKHIVVNENLLTEIFKDLGVTEECISEITKRYKEVCTHFGYPTDIELLDEKAAKKARKELAHRELKERLETMKILLEDAAEELDKAQRIEVSMRIRDYLGDDQE